MSNLSHFLGGLFSEAISKNGVESPKMGLSRGIVMESILAMINDHRIDKIENRFESWCDHHRHHHSGACHWNRSISSVESPNKESKKRKSSEFKPAPCPLNGFNRNFNVFAFYAYKTEYSVVPWRDGINHFLGTQLIISSEAEYIYVENKNIIPVSWTCSPPGSRLSSTDSLTRREETGRDDDVLNM